MVKTFSKVISSIVFTIAVCLSPVAAQEYVGGVLPGNTVFSPSLNPYIVVETLIVPEGITLTIEPGTEIFFMVTTSVSIEGGTLIANGSPEQPILFDAQTDNKWDGLNFFVSRTLFDGQGNYLSGNILRYISIKQTTKAVVLADSAMVMADNINVINGDYGIYLQSGSTLLLTSSVIDQCSYGMYIKNSGNNTISSCRISNCDIGIFFPSTNESSHNLISNNTLSYNRNIALFMSIGQSKIQFNRIYGNTVEYNNIGLHIGNGGIGDLGYNSLVSNIVQYNDIGIKLSQDADTLRANLIESNATGVILAKANNNHILNNIIQNNTQPGLILTDGSSLNTVSGNGIYSNYTGIKVTHKDFKYSINNLFSYNSLSGNLNEAFLFESGPQKPLVFNSIVGNRDTAILVNRFETDLEAPGNWFGTADTTKIDSLIFDYFDNEIYGKVIYKPFLTYPDPQAPISKPRMAIKRLIGNRISVDWLNNPEMDLAGYKVYYGHGPGTLFSDVIDVGPDTLALISGIGLEDPLAVTAYDTEANGNADQFEGHESAYSYAIAGPYTGNDTLICMDAGYLAVNATAPDGQILVWTSSGDGVFTGPSNLTTLYSPGPADILNGLVTLTLSQQMPQFMLTDEIVVSISGVPALYAGNDTIINQHETFFTSSAEAANYTKLLWTTTGDGSFVDSLALLTSYLPGAADITLGYVSLILNLTSFCGNLSDTVRLEIIPSYAVNGKVHRQSQPAGDGIVVAINTVADSHRAISTVYTNSEGEFGFNNLPVGNYFLYAISDPQANHQWIPTYYAEKSFWQTAYRLPLNTDVFDVDINLLRINDALPAGTGSISGFFNYAEKSGDDDSIYMKPWFTDNYYRFGSNPGIPAANHVVLLMNTQLNRIFGWELTSVDGAFYFDQLPFGSYRLWGEKAGYVNSLSPVITLSTANSGVEGVLLSVNHKNIEVTLPGDEIPAKMKGILYPNPARESVWINPAGISPEEPVELNIYTSDGRLVMQIRTEMGMPAGNGQVDISGLKTGLYLVTMISGNNAAVSMKLSVVR